MTQADDTSHTFLEGENALLIDRRGRRYMVKLKGGARYDTHLGPVLHDAIIGQPDGAWVLTSRDHRLIAVKPTLADFVLQMPRIATVIYPKDLGAILIYGDIFPGARVVEAGSGSGALTMTLLRAVGQHGHVASYDLRQDMIDRARENIDVMLPGYANFTLKVGDVAEGIDERGVDRIVLDLPEPWHVVPHAAESLRPGGIFLSFLPTVLQVHEFTLALRAHGSFELIETFELIMRSWSVGNRSIRPDHRMVAHTGFITTARKCQPKPQDETEDAEVTGEASPAPEANQ